MACSRTCNLLYLKIVRSLKRCLISESKGAIKYTLDGSCEQLLLYLLRNSELNETVYLSFNVRDTIAERHGCQSAMHTNIDDLVFYKKHIIINSINSMLIGNNLTFDSLYQRLQKFIDSGCTLTCILHTDLIPRNEVKIVKNMFRYMATSTLKCYPNDSYVKVIKRKDYGKIQKERVRYVINMAENILTSEKVGYPVKKLPKNQKKIDVKTTFKIELSEEERSTKNQLVLPFYRQQRSSEISYDPDENDDWDIEDPDDDLDF